MRAGFRRRGSRIRLDRGRDPQAPRGKRTCVGRRCQAGSGRGTRCGRGLGLGGSRSSIPAYRRSRTLGTEGDSREGEGRANRGDHRTIARNRANPDRPSLSMAGIPSGAPGRDVQRWTRPPGNERSRDETEPAIDCRSPRRNAIEGLRQGYRGQLLDPGRRGPVRAQIGHARPALARWTRRPPVGARRTESRGAVSYNRGSWPPRRS